LPSSLLLCACLLLVGFDTYSLFSVHRRELVYQRVHPLIVIVSCLGACKKLPAWGRTAAVIVLVPTATSTWDA
jgi:hypothetical protein